jgi:hypothetical protein
VLLNGIMRDLMPTVIPDTPEFHVDQFVLVFLRGIGVTIPPRA